MHQLRMEVQQSGHDNAVCVQIVHILKPLMLPRKCYTNDMLPIGNIVYAVQPACSPTHAGLVAGANLGKAAQAGRKQKKLPR